MRLRLRNRHWPERNDFMSAVVRNGMLMDKGIWAIEFLLSKDYYKRALNSSTKRK